MDKRVEMDNQSSVHLFIIWSEAESFLDQIVSDIGDHFIIRNRFIVHWDESFFKDNLRVFYAHSQKHLSDSKYNLLLENKMAHCGKGPFHAIVIEDSSPCYEERETSSGIRLVNTHVFDKKVEYRQLTKGGHRIHGSDDAWETNKDLTLLFGHNTEDFYSAYNEDPNNEIKIMSNCLGVGGFKSIERLFYLLNNTISYCVLRNFECLPDNYTVEGHGDIDLLVENLNYVKYLTGAKKVFPEDFRVYHTVSIEGKSIPFDFRYVGDYYYDRLWEEEILRTSHLEKKTFYAPDDENLFYSLLYHAYIQKNSVKLDYLPKLKQYANTLGIDYSPGAHPCVQLLDTFLKTHQYEYARPNDKTVVYNQDTLALSSYAERYGSFIKRVQEKGSNGYVYDSLVYEKEDSFVKRGTQWIIENEYTYLNRLRRYPCFPFVCEYRDDDENRDYSYLELSRIEGSPFTDYFRNIRAQRARVIKSFIRECLYILELLNKESVIHRDFLPSNLIVSKKSKGRVKVGLIDFGWAIDKKAQSPKTPALLGGLYAPKNAYSDLYSLGSILLEFWGDLHSIRKIAAVLQRDLSSSSSVLLLRKCRRLLLIPLSPKDELKLMMRRHLRLQYLKHSFFKQ